MATVYKAYQPSLDRYVALKILPPYYAQQDVSFLERFKREAHVVAKLRHPNILMVMDFGQDNQLSYIVMDYVEAGTLKERMQKTMTLAEISTFISQIGSALEYAHNEGVVHRDVKPSNVLLPKPDWALLTDFGLARMVGGSMLTQSGMSVGTPAYMSPEQGSGDSVDSRSDVYSLGVMLYEMTTGEVPYTAETPMAVMVKHIVEPLPVPHERNPDLPEALERIVLKAMAKDPNDRFQTAGELADAVKSVEAEHPDWISPARSTPATMIKPKTDVLQPETVPDKEVDPSISDSSPDTLKVTSPKSSEIRRLTLKRILGAAFLVVSLGVVGFFAYSSLLTPSNPADNSTSPQQADEANEKMIAAFQLLEAGQNEEALVAFAEVLSISPDQWDIYLETAHDIYNIGKDTHIAIRMLEFGLGYVEQPKVEDISTLAQWYLEVGEFKHARDTFYWALDIDPNDPWLYIGLTEVFIEMDEPEQAIVAAQGAITYAGFDSDVLDSAGWLSYEVGEYSLAVEAFEQAIQTEDSNPWSYIGLAEVYMAIHENLDQVPSLLLIAVQNGQNDPLLLESVGWLYIEIQDCEQATLYLLEALALAPQLPNAQKGLDECDQHDS
jgi:serine/threonine protein kinase